MKKLARDSFAEIAVVSDLRMCLQLNTSLLHSKQLLSLFHKKVVIETVYP